MNEQVAIVITTHSPEQTRALGAALAGANLRAPSDQTVVIALNGELGAGKTTFVGGFMRALGVEGAVRSPTYTLIEPYEIADRLVYHLDLYRLADPRELEMLAPRDLLEPGAIQLVEWAERAGGVLPRADLSITFKYPADEVLGGADRTVEISAGTAVGRQLAASLQ